MSDRPSQLDAHPGLDGMIDSLRDVVREDEARLTDAARETVRRKIRQGRRRPELAPLFTPFSHWAYAAGIPAATALLLAATFALQTPEPGMIAGNLGSADRQRVEEIRVYKVGGRVIFEGSGVSGVERSVTPDFSTGTSLSENGGRFVDTNETGSGLVFYRID